MKICHIANIACAVLMTHVKGTVTYEPRTDELISRTSNPVQSELEVFI